MVYTTVALLFFLLRKSAQTRSLAVFFLPLSKRSPRGTHNLLTTNELMLKKEKKRKTERRRKKKRKEPKEKNKE